MLERTSGIVWRIDIDAFYFSGVSLLQRLKRKQVIAVNEHIFTVRITVIAVRIMQQNSWFDTGFLAFSDPCQFKLLHLFIVLHVLVAHRINPLLQ
jgi:hypothetical protein